MKYLEFQKMLKKLKDEGMYIGTEFVVVRRDIYESELDRLRRLGQMQKHIQTVN